MDSDRNSKDSGYILPEFGKYGSGKYNDNKENIVNRANQNNTKLNKSGQLDNLCVVSTDKPFNRKASFRRSYNSLHNTQKIAFIERSNNNSKFSLRKSFAQNLISKNPNSKRSLVTEIKENEDKKSQAESALKKVNNKRLVVYKYKVDYEAKRDEAGFQIQCQLLEDLKDQQRDFVNLINLIDRRISSLHQKKNRETYQSDFSGKYADLKNKIELFLQKEDFAGFDKPKPIQNGSYDYLNDNYNGCQFSTHSQLNFEKEAHDFDRQKIFLEKYEQHYESLGKDTSQFYDQCKEIDLFSCEVIHRGFCNKNKAGNTLGPRLRQIQSKKQKYKQKLLKELRKEFDQLGSGDEGRLFLVDEEDQSQARDSQDFSFGDC